MGLIANEIVTQVLDRCDIVEVISGYIPLKRAGRNFKALCPFHHEKSPSFVISPDKQIYHCFGCAAGGNVIGFVMQQERLEFPEAVRFLADKVGIVIPEASPGVAQAGQLKLEVLKLNETAVEYYNQNLLKASDLSVTKAREYLKERGVKIEDVKQFKLGFAFDSWDGLSSIFKSKNVPLKLLERSGLVALRDSGEGFYDRFRDRIIFPIFDVKSQCVGFGARTMKDEKGAKYINSPDTPAYTKGQHLFGLQLTRNAIAKKDFVIVVEGYMDMIIPYQYGVDNIVASLGTALTIEQIRLLRRYTNNVVMLFDADSAGQAAIVRSLDLLIEQEMNVKVARLATDEDPDSFIRKFGVDEFHANIQNAQTLFDFKLQWLSKQFDSKNIEQRAVICDQMLVTIHKIKNEVVRFGYIRQLAERLGLPEQIVLKEGKKFESPSSGREKFNEPLRKTSVPKVINSVERYVLEILLHDASLIVQVKDQLSSSDFQDSRVREIVEKLFEVLDAGGNFSIASFLNYFNDPEVREIILNISATDHSAGKETKLVLDEYIARIKKIQLTARKKNLDQSCSEAERIGDHVRLEQLRQELNQIIKEISVYKS